jgi:hypothetical protein
MALTTESAEEREIDVWVLIQAVEVAGTYCDSDGRV